MLIISNAQKQKKIYRHFVVETKLYSNKFLLQNKRCYKQNGENNNKIILISADI